MEELIGKLLDRQTSLERLFEGLALVLDERGTLPLAELVPVLLMAQENAGMTEGAEVAGCMAFVTDRLAAHAAARAEGASPLQTLRDETAMYRRHPSRLRSALRSWLEVASVEEIADDLACTRASSDPPPAADNGQETGPDEPGGKGG